MAGPYTRILAFDIGGTGLKAALVDSRGKFLSERLRVPTPKNCKPEAMVKLQVKGKTRMTVAEGNGPVNALDAAIRKSLIPKYPHLKGMSLADYKVRILTPQEATAALTRVMIESRDEKGNSWTTIGVSHNVIDASYNALEDAITYHLLKRA